MEREKIEITLTDDEINALQDHYNRLIHLNDQMNRLRSEMIREQRDLELSWKSVLQDRIIKKEIELAELPKFIDIQGRPQVQIIKDKATF